jgi:hypothetical protein
VCPDGSSCPHAGAWQCDAYCDDWSPLLCGPAGALAGCKFTACGDAGCANFFVQEGCNCNHPCNICKGGCYPPDPIHVDLCQHTAFQVCRNGNCNGKARSEARRSGHACHRALMTPCAVMARLYHGHLLLPERGGPRVGPE